MNIQSHRNKSAVLIALVTLIGASPALAGAADVIPLPQRIEKLGEPIVLDKDHPLRFVMAGWGCKTCKTTLRQLTDELKTLGVAIVDGEAPGVITLYAGCPSGNRDQAARCKKADALPDRKWGPDGYRLKVAGEQVLIAGNDQRGTYYGMQTFRQMLEPIEDGKGVRLERVDIRDWPAMTWRGTMFGLQTPDEHARLAGYKMNLLNWEINQNPDFKTIPEFAGGTPMSHYRKVAESCKQHYISLVLETQSFGHVSWMLAKFPQLRALPDDTHVLRPLHEPTYDLIGRIYAELCPLYDTPIYHAGCDEAWGIEEWAEKQGLDVDAVIGKHIQKLADMLKKHGKRTMIWGDYLLKHPGAIEHMNPKDYIICDWHYTPTERYPSVDFFVGKGFETLVSPAVMPARPIFPNYDRQIENIRGFIQYGAKHGAAGLLNTNWPVSPMPTEVYWYGWACGAEYAWNPTGRTQDEFDRAFFKQAYGLNGKQGRELFRKMAKLGVFHQLDQQIARAPTSLLSEAVRRSWQIVAPKMQPAQTALIDDASKALDAAISAASPDGKKRLGSFRQIVHRLRAGAAYLDRIEALGGAIAELGSASDPDENRAAGRFILRTCGALLRQAQTDRALPKRDELRTLSESIRTHLTQTDGVNKVLALLDLKRRDPSKTVRIKPGTCLRVLSDSKQVPPPRARREGWCHFPRSGGAAEWTFRFKHPGRYRVFALLRHSAGIWRDGKFVGGGHNAAYVGKYGWKLDGKPFQERWLGKELNPEADEALRWALLADQEFRPGEHTLSARISGMNHAIVAEFVFTQDADFEPDTHVPGLKMK